MAIRYEDLLADTAGTLRQVCDFISLDIETEALDQAVRASSFERMREIEERELGRPDIVSVRPVSDQERKFSVQMSGAG